LKGRTAIFWYSNVSSLTKPLPLDGGNPPVKEQPVSKIEEQNNPAMIRPKAKNRSDPMPNPFFKINHFLDINQFINAEM
jgi:hypothetical protein